MRRATAPAVLLLTIALTRPAAAGEPVPFSHAGTCEQVGVVVTVETARLAPYVPDGFPIATVLGRSPLMVTGGRCEGVVEGEPVRPNAWGLVLVPSSHPDDPFSFGGHAYDLWWLNSERRTALGYRRLGIRSEHARRAFLARRDRAITFDALRARAYPFAVSVEELHSPAPRFGLQTFHWHVGRHGRVLVDPEHENLRLTGGLGRIRAPAGSPLADILGAEDLTGAGGVLRFSFRGSYGAA